MIDTASQVIRGYELRELIGKGGFAAVYRAFQPTVEREVAIKIILAKYANDPGFVRRFETEAQLIARLEHLHIVPLYDYWREPNNAYLVMRWLRGGNLFRSIQKGGPWELRRAAHLIEQVASALATAHRNGIIHRDLSPANILLDEDDNAFLADFGIAKDIVDDHSKDERIYGSPAYMAPEQIRSEPVSAQTDIYSLGIVVYQILTGHTPFEAPTVPGLLEKQLYESVPPLQAHRSDLPYDLNAIIMKAMAKDPVERYSDAMSLAGDFNDIVQRPDKTTSMETKHAAPSQQAAHSRTLGFGTLVLAASIAPVNPYKGLRPFDEADASDFFGRDTLINHLIKSVRDSRFLAVVGPSGSGKSSVIKAGLMPALRKGALPGSDKWFTTKMMPGANPFEELRNALLSVAFDPATTLFGLLRQSERGLYNTVRQMLPDDDTELVLIIDQFEELFTLVTNEEDRTRFLNSIRYAVSQPETRLRVIITLRADFYDRPLLYAEFGQLIREHTEVVLPLSSLELQEAIAGPAERVGMTLQPGLTAAIIADVNEQPGALPLLQYALTELFERRDGHKLTLDAYRESGGVLGALARRAEEIYERMQAPYQEATRQLFMRLVRLGEGTEDTRRRAHWAELISLSGEQKTAMQSVIDTFGKHRLLTFDRDPETREPTVEIAHEALIREWKQLRKWLNDNRENLQIQQRLVTATTEWVNAGQDASYLASGARLTQFETLSANGSGLVLNETERSYVQASIIQRQRAIWRLRAFIAALIVFSIVATGLAIFAFDRQNRAETAQKNAENERDRADAESRTSHSRELAMAGLTTVTQPDLSLLLSLEALKVDTTFEAYSSLLTTLEYSPYLNAFLYGHTGEVRAVIFSPDGRFIASAGQDATIQLWDTVTHQPAGDPFTGHTDTINSLAYSPDGTLLASGSRDYTVRLWDVTTGESIRELTGHTDEVWSVAYSPDGTLLASAGRDGTIRFWDVATGDPVGEPITSHGEEGFVYSVAFSPDGAMLASGGDDNLIHLWDVETHEPLGDPLSRHTNWVWQVAFSPDGQILASASADQTLILWDMESRSPINQFAGHTRWVRGVSFSPDGTRLASASEDGMVRLWDIATGDFQELKGHQDRVWAIAYSPDSRLVASASVDQTVILWNTNLPYPARATLIGHQDEVNDLTYSPDGRFLVSAGGSQASLDNSIYVWDAATGENLATLVGHGWAVNNVEFSPDGSILASASADQTIRLWDTSTWEPIGEPLIGHQSPVWGLAFSPDGSILASSDENYTANDQSFSSQIILWDTSTWESRGESLTGHEGKIEALAFSPDGSILASAGVDSKIILWDTTTWEPLGEPLTGHTNEITRLVFSSDGQMLVSASRDGTILLWDVATRQPLHQPLIGHTNYIFALAFSPDNQLLASGSRDETIRLWDVATGQTFGQPLTGQQGWIKALAFSPDGTTLASGSQNYSIWLWTINREQWQEQACRIVNRNFTKTEWQRYFGDQPFETTCLQGDETPTG